MFSPMTGLGLAPTSLGASISKAGTMTGIVINLADATRHGATPEQWGLLSMVMGHTEDLLPIVANPKATISVNSSIKRLGKTPSTYNYAREVIGLVGWAQKVTTDLEVELWAKEPDYGIGMQTRLVRALDVDVDDMSLAGAIRTFIAGFLGVELPERTRANSGKFLLAFILSGEFGKRSMKVQGGMIEFLGTGNQFVVLGRHTSGTHYHWPAGFPPEFPTVIEAKFEDLWAALADRFAIETPFEQNVSGKAEKIHAAIQGDPVAQHLIEQKVVKRFERDGRLHITCPFEDKHTTEGGDTATTYWPAHTGGYQRGHFHCLHAHCAGKSDDDFRVGVGYVDHELLTEFAALGVEGDRSAAMDDEGDPGAENGPAAHQPKAEKLDRKLSYRVLRPPEYQHRPEPVWIIKGVLPKAELAVVFGESGAGKSFVVMDMALAIDRGIEWRGKKTKKLRVIYVAAEGAGGIRGRLMAYCNQHGLAINDLHLGIIEATPNMLDKQDALDLARSILAAGGADLIILDTWAQVTAGANENSGEEMGKALAHCRGICRATGAMTLLVHHAGKDLTKGARGWSGLRAAADCEIEISRSDDFRMARVTKLKNGLDGQEFGFTLEEIILGYDEDGDEITSCVVKDLLITEMKDGPKGKWQQICWKVIQEFGQIQRAGIEIDVVIEEVKRTTAPELDARGADRRRSYAVRAIDELAKRDFMQIDNGTITLV